jgi:hypothetical protein
MREAIGECVFCYMSHPDGRAYVGPDTRPAGLDSAVAFPDPATARVYGLTHGLWDGPMAFSDRWPLHMSVYLMPLPVARAADAAKERVLTTVQRHFDAARNKGYM